MRYKKQLPANIWRALGLIVLALSLANTGSAQATDQATGKANPAAQDASKKTDGAGVEPATPVGLYWADSQIRQIGTSGLLAGSRVGIGWGSLYIPSAGVSGIVAQFEGTSTIPSSTYTAAILQTTVVYDHKLGNSRLAIQYQPSMAIAEGQVVGNFSNQNTSIDLLLYTRPRWNVRFHDGFQYYYTQQSFGLPYLDASSVTAGSVTNNFLDGPGRWLSNNAGMTIAYALSLRSSIVVTPNYMFSESGTGASFARGASYGGSLNWNYRTSQKQTVGLQYIGQLIHETRGITTYTVFHTVAGTLQRQLSATWSIRGSLGVTTSEVSQNERQWSVYGTFGLVKELGRSTIALNYSRGDTFASGLISNEYGDRVDLSYQHQLSRRLNWGGGWGYLRQIRSGGFSGWYTSVNVQYLLAPRAGLFAVSDYYHKSQTANTIDLFSGDSNTYFFGLRWQPGRIRH